MADTKGTALNAITTAALTDIVIAVDDPGGTPETKKITVSNLNAVLPADAVDAITEIAAALKSGADGTLVTGTAGSDTEFAIWNSDGDLVATGWVVASNVVTAAGNLDMNDKALLGHLTSINAQTDDYELVLSDSGKTVTMTKATANVLTIPTNANAAFPVGAQVTIWMGGAGTTSVTGDTGVTLNGASAGSGDISNQYSAVTLLKIATDTWLMAGDHGGVS